MMQILKLVCKTTLLAQQTSEILFLMCYEFFYLFIPLYFLVSLDRVGNFKNNIPVESECVSKYKPDT